MGRPSSETRRSGSERRLHLHSGVTPVGRCWWSWERPEGEAVACELHSLRLVHMSTAALPVSAGGGPTRTDSVVIAPIFQMSAGKGERWGDGGGG